MTALPRVQLALNVSDVDAAVDFYSRLFGAEPHKPRPGYANFALDAPPLKLVLIENAAAAGSINHLGVEVADTAEASPRPSSASPRRAAARDEADVVCCHARQDKVWVERPGRRLLGGLHDHRRQPRALAGDGRADGSADAGCCACCAG